MFLFIKWAYKYNNPFKLFFVMGKKGSGKTSYLCKIALQYYKKGWTIYTNVCDLMIPGIRYITDITSLGDYVPEPNSLILLDEVSLVWDNRNYKNFKDSTKEFFRLQRHYRCVVYLFSQTFDVDKKIRDLADRMYLSTQFLGRWSLLREINKKIVITESSADSESRISENLSFCGIFSWRFVYIPKYQPYFDSFILPERPLLEYAVSECVLPPDRRMRVKARARRSIRRLVDLLLFNYGRLLGLIFLRIPALFRTLSMSRKDNDISDVIEYSSLSDFWQNHK